MSQMIKIRLFLKTKISKRIVPRRRSAMKTFRLISSNKRIRTSRSNPSRIRTSNRSNKTLPKLMSQAPIFFSNLPRSFNKSSKRRRTSRRLKSARRRKTKRIPTRLKIQTCARKKRGLKTIPKVTTAWSTSWTNMLRKPKVNSVLTKSSNKRIKQSRPRVTTRRCRTKTRRSMNLSPMNLWKEINRLRSRLLKRKTIRSNSRSTSREIQRKS